MRKRYKNKKCCCKMCKDYKRGRANRWDGRELALLKQFERLLTYGFEDTRWT